MTKKGEELKEVVFGENDLLWVEFCYVYIVEVLIVLVDKVKMFVNVGLDGGVVGGRDLIIG